MVLQIFEESPSLTSTSNAKKKTTKKVAWNNLMIETRCATALNLLLEKKKEDFIQGADQAQKGKLAY